jgi:hypothetical protein
LILGSLIVVGVLLSLALRAVESKHRSDVNLATALVVRITIAVSSGWEAIRAIKRGGPLFTCIAAFLGLLALSTAVLAGVVLRVILFRRSDLNDRPENTTSFE